MLAPKVHVLEANSPAYATAAEGTVVVGKAPFAGTVTAVTVVPVAAITGQDTNTRKYSLINKGAAGSGTAPVAGLQFNSGVNGVAFDEKALTLSVTAADLEVVAGDVIALFSDAILTGLADPGCRVFVTISRDRGD
jgi:hypothetical protein